MPALDALVLVADSPVAGQAQVRVPSAADNYNFPRPVTFSAGSVSSLSVNIPFSGSVAQGFYAVADNDIGVALNGVLRWRIGSGVFRAIDSTGNQQFAINGQTGALMWGPAEDAVLVRDAANALALRRTTNAQEFRTYGTFTDASNHRRVAIGMSTGGAGYIRPEGAGTGASGNTMMVSHGATTVAALPAASTAGAGARMFVTDANATTFQSIVAGGGSNGVPVFSDGTNWRIG